MMDNFFSESQILRLLVTCTEKNEEERKQILDRRLASLSQGHFPVSNLTEYVQFVSQYISFHEARRAQRSKHTYFEQIFKSYSGSDLQMEESEGTYFNHNFFINITSQSKNYLSVYIYSSTLNYIWKTILIA